MAHDAMLVLFAYAMVAQMKYVCRIVEATRR